MATDVVRVAACFTPACEQILPCGARYARPWRFIESGPAGYDKKTVANDIWTLMYHHLEHARFAVVGHDWGAPVAFRLAADHPGEVTHLAMLDVPVPGDQPWGSAISGAPRWWHIFHQVPDLPEALVYGRERTYLEWFYMWGCNQAGAIGDSDIAEYVRTYSQPGAMRAGFNFYRTISKDVADNRTTFATGFKLPMPALGLGGGGSRGRGDLVVESLRRVSIRASGGSIADCGHFIPEEKPAELASQLLEFFDS
jgi:pimeloyl-ACP methyl ester carboxylesterase